MFNYRNTILLLSEISIYNANLNKRRERKGNSRGLYSVKYRLFFFASECRSEKYLARIVKVACKKDLQTNVMFETCIRH